MNHAPAPRDDTTPMLKVPVLLTVAETARILRLHEGSVTRLYRSGKLTGGMIGRKLLLEGRSVVAYLNEAGIPAQVVEDVA